MNTFGVDEVRPVVVTIDMHRGHLDPAVATMPVLPGTEKQTIDANARFLRAGRAAGVPVIHMLTQLNSATEVRMNPFWRTRADNPTATRSNVERHNIRGGPGCELMPEILDAKHDVVLDTKRRYDCFIATDLEFVLRGLKANVIFMTGINTNSCVLATAVAACNRDFAAVVVEDCVDTMDGPEMHEHGLAVVRAAFGWTMTSREVQQEVFAQVAERA